MECGGSTPPFQNETFFWHLTRAKPGHGLRLPAACAPRILAAQFLRKVVWRGLRPESVRSVESFWKGGVEPPHSMERRGVGAAKAPGQWRLCRVFVPR